MAQVLVIECSARLQGSVSRLLSETFISHWRTLHPKDSVTIRNLAVDPVPHLDADLLGGWMKPVAQQSECEKRALQRSNLLTEELLAADVLVLAMPMYNFGIPSTLKAWLDHVVRAGMTFKYTDSGPQGLVNATRAFVLTARGGIYSGSPQDHQEPYLRQVLGFMGIYQVQFIHAEGLNLGDEFKRRGLHEANARLELIR